jgi:uncharacterized protein
MGRTDGVESAIIEGLPFARNSRDRAVSPFLSMQLDLTRYRQPLDHFSRSFEPGELGAEEDAYRIVAPVHLDLDIHKDKERFRLVGTARTELEVPCSRCLEPFRMPVDAALDLRYLPATELTADADREVPEEDLETGFYRDDQLDLNELLREQFYLALPMKPLCRDDCRGLCPQCGANRNAGGCSCAITWEDPRLAPLKGLMKPSDSSTNSQ